MREYRYQEKLSAKPLHLEWLGEATFKQNYPFFSGFLNHELPFSPSLPLPLTPYTFVLWCGQPCLPYVSFSFFLMMFNQLLTFQKLSRTKRKKNVFLFLCLWYVAAAKLLQSCPTLCDPLDSSPPGSIVPGILQARTLEWVAISFSNAGKWKVKVKSLSHVRLLATPWTAAYQTPPPMGFSRQEDWSGVPLPSPVYDMRNPLKHGAQGSSPSHLSLRMILGAQV